MAEQKTAFVYHNVVLEKSESLGSGSYGGVCKAKCDGLLCAAKIMHPTLFDIRDPGTASYLRKFQEECHLLSLARHPNVVQYLGTYTDPDTRLPVLLMELCDESLTSFLERSPGPLSYHVQVNICHDIALALVYLHSNGLIHRDLTGNNILLIPGPRAKITDFGMSKLASVNLRMTAMTLCPGNLLYMSPEALDEAKSYTSKLDIFSFGVIAIQILTRQFPNPTDRFQLVSFPQFEEPLRQVVPETERRQAHLHLIPDIYPLKQLAIQCLNTKANGRPSALKLNDVLSELKLSSPYSESMQQADSIQRPVQQQILTESQAMESNPRQSRILELERALRDKDREHEQEITRRDLELERKEMELQQTREELQASRQLVSELHKEISSSLKQPMRQTQPMVVVGQKGISSMKWKEGKKAPELMRRGAAVVHGNTVYFRPAVSDKIYSYQYLDGEEVWSQEPENPNLNFGMAIVGGVLTSVGGRKPHPTNTLLSLTEEGERKVWCEIIPPMPTPRSSAACVTTNRHLVVAGGLGDGGSLNNVEVMNMETKEWTTASPLPRKCLSMSAALIGDTLCLAGGVTGYLDSGGVLHYRMLNSVFTCSSASLFSLADPSSSHNVWREMHSLPVVRTTLVSFCGHLLAIGGRDDSGKQTTDVYRYDSHADSWIVVSHMKRERSRCLAVSVSDDCLVVAGGYQGNIETNSVEILH